MSAPKNSDPTKFWLSPSRIDSFEECSQRYAAHYLWKLPDAGNDGSNRGSTCHDVLELLAKPRHKQLYSAAIHHNTCMEVPALWRFVTKVARRYGVGDPENLQMIDGFILVALKNEFHGPAGTVEAFSEREFNISIDQDGKHYNVRGKIDRTFIVKDQLGLMVSTLDWKSSKDLFKDKKATFNVQSIIYSLALKHLYPEIERRRFRFLFLRFAASPWQEMPPMDDEQLEGYEYVLTDLQERIEGFTLANVADNLPTPAPFSGFPCGKEGTKKNGEPYWVCPARRPLDYWVSVKDGKIMKSAFKQEDLTPREGETVEKRSYPGCVRFYRPDGTKLPFQS